MHLVLLHYTHGNLSITGYGILLVAWVVTLIMPWRPK